ncbi:MAG TPA: histidinol-phosphate transaminase [Steroidobacteraceae bacterium]|nr:histidinol-phosphate transaminase [Steroidobacteraceae bacterium]
MSWVTELARPEVVGLKAYEHAPFEAGLTRLHANESPWRVPGDGSEAGLNRYPEPQSTAVRARLARLYGCDPRCLLISRGSDEAIDLLVRAFCRAGQDAVLTCPPTFGMYAVAAHIQGAQLVSVPLDAARGYRLDVRGVLHAATPAVKLVFLCSPNNPTGNLLQAQDVLRVATALTGRALVVVDEAYVEFASRPGLTAVCRDFPQLAVLRTLSKAHGLAGARLGALIADPEVIALLRKLIAPYAVPQLVLESVARLLDGTDPQARARLIARVRASRDALAAALTALPAVAQVLPSEANFLLVRLGDPAGALARARAAGLLVRDARGYPGLGDALRVSIGTEAQNARLLEAWR